MGLLKPMLYCRHGNTSLFGNFRELLPHRVFDDRLGELDTDLVLFVMRFWRPVQVQFQVQRKEVFEGFVEDRFEGLCVPEHELASVGQVDALFGPHDGPFDRDRQVLEVLG